MLQAMPACLIDRGSIAMSLNLAFFLTHALYLPVHRLFCQLSLGGPATGLAFGLASTVWLRFMYNNFLGEITLTIAAAYATYLVADQLFGVSAVLAVVVLGALTVLSFWPIMKGHAVLRIQAVAVVASACHAASCPLCLLAELLCRSAAIEHRPESRLTATRQGRETGDKHVLQAPGWLPRAGRTSA